MISEHMIADLVRSVTPVDPRGPVSTAVPNLTIYSAAKPSDAVPALFEPRFYVLLQGAKRMMIAGRDLHVRPGDCAISTIGLPFHTQVVEASTAKPYIGVTFALDTEIVSDLLLTMPDAAEESGPAFASGVLTEDLCEPVGRLLKLLASPADIPVLAPLFERELAYRLARGPMGATLRLAARHHTRFSQVRAAVAWIRTNADAPMRVEALASLVGMSVTSLHRHFRAVTGTSPLAYQRHIRLLAARKRIVADGSTVTAAALASGYESASQFSRDYKQMFGTAPIRDRASIALSH